MQRLLSRAFARPELWVLVALSAATHFWRLWSPNAVVWDELHYERFAGHYLSRTFYFDVHPPLGNLLYAGLARLVGISAAQLTLPEPAPILRLLPALFGTLTVPLLYILLRQLGSSRRVALLGGLLALLDNGLLVESRYILLDSFLIFFGLCAVVSYLAARKRAGTPRWGFLIMSALFAGCALTVKWTGASALGLILGTSFVVDVLIPRVLSKRTIAEGLMLIAIPMAIYLTAFAVHFELLTHSGPGDSSMSARFQEELIGHPRYDPARHLSFWAKLQNVHHAIRYGNASLERTTHAGSSAWYTWPIMKHPIAFWERLPATAGERTMIILLGNPLVWWGAMIGSLVGVAAFLLHRRRFAGRELGFAFLLGGALLNFLPFAAIHRLMYIYHYLFGLTFVIALAAFSTGVLAGWMQHDERLWWFASRRSAALYAGIIALVLIGFVYFLPFTYGWPLSDQSWEARFWVLHPRF